MSFYSQVLDRINANKDLGRGISMAAVPGTDDAGWIRGTIYICGFGKIVPGDDSSGLFLYLSEFLKEYGQMNKMDMIKNTEIINQKLLRIYSIDDKTIKK